MVNPPAKATGKSGSGNPIREQLDDQLADPETLNAVVSSKAAEASIPACSVDPLGTFNPSLSRKKKFSFSIQ